MRTLGFPAQWIFLFIAGEGLLISVTGGVIGALLAWFIADGEKLGISGGFAPVFAVSPGNAGLGIGISALIGLIAGTIPAVMASRLKIVDALRRVA
jgi:putative ABC transport system permease protein